MSHRHNTNDDEYNSLVRCSRIVMIVEALRHFVSIKVDKIKASRGQI